MGHKSSFLSLVQNSIQGRRDGPESSLTFAIPPTFDHGGGVAHRGFVLPLLWSGVSQTLTIRKVYGTAALQDPLKSGSMGTVCQVVQTQEDPTRYRGRAVTLIITVDDYEIFYYVRHNIAYVTH